MTFLAALARSALFSGILLLGGTAALYWIVLRSVPQRSALVGEAGRACTFACVLLLTGLLLALAAQLAEFRDPLEPLLSQAALLFSTSWGPVWLVQLAAAVVSLIGCTLIKDSRGAWTVTAFAAFVLCGSPAFASHAIASEHWMPLAVASDVVHVIAGSIWIGGLVALTWLIGREHVRQPAAAGQNALLLIRRFSPVALMAAATIVASGLVGVLLHLTAVRDLWASTYGRLLSVKLAAFLCVLAAGAYNWRRATPRLEQSGDAGAMRRSMLIESGFALLLVVVTAFFVATPPPGE